MKKRIYIQPNCETMVLPKEALMGEDLTLSSSGSMGTVGGGSSAPKFAPVLPTDTVTVF